VLPRKGISGWKSLCLETSNVSLLESVKRAHLVIKRILKPASKLGGNRRFNVSTMIPKVRNWIWIFHVGSISELTFDSFNMSYDHKAKSTQAQSCKYTVEDEEFAMVNIRLSIIVHSFIVFISHHFSLWNVFFRIMIDSLSDDLCPTWLYGICICNETKETPFKSFRPTQTRESSQRI
jgi:hypothetical protein